MGVTIATRLPLAVFISAMLFPLLFQYRADISPDKTINSTF